MTQNNLKSKNDTQESLYDTEYIAPCRKANKKCDAFKNTLTNELIKEATNTLKNLNELKTQHSSYKTGDDIFCEVIAVHLKYMNEGAAKEFLKLYIHYTVITAIHHNSGHHNATVPVPQAGNTPSFAGVNVISPPMTPTMRTYNILALIADKNNINAY